MTTTLALEQAKDFISRFLDSTEFDYDYLVKDMNDVFENYQWRCKSNLPECEKTRWYALLSIGEEDGLTQQEANEFFKNTDPEGEHHLALQHYLAKRWLQNQ